MWGMRGIERGSRRGGSLESSPSATVPARVFPVNGEIYAPFTPEQRTRLQEEHTARVMATRRHLATLKDDDASIIHELTACMKSFDYWCDHYAYTFDPRKRPSAVSFVLYPYQREAAARIIQAIRQGTDLLIEKSRDMGASWLVVAVLTWCWLFEESFHGHLGSRKEDLVDDGGPDSLLGKVDYILERLPPWMLNGYSQKNRKRLRAEHPATGSLITGESANAGFGRGPRKNVVIFDEFAFTEEDEAIWTGIQDTSPCHIVVSTPCGELNKFAQLRRDGQVPVLTFHWTEHPYKDEAWYDDACARRTAREVAQELNIDYKASGGRLAFPQLQDDNWLRRIIVPPPTPQEIHEGGWTVYAGMDWGTTNPACWYPVAFRKITPSDTMPGRHILEIRVLWEFYKPSTLEELSSVIRHSPWSGVVRRTFADPSMWYYNQNSKDGVTSVAFLFRDLYGIHLDQGVRGDTSFLNLVADSWKSIDNVRLTISEECVNLIREWKNLQYATRSLTMSQRKNALEALVDKDNHSCFPAGTRVLTPSGWVAIENIKQGDEVMTHLGVGYATTDAVFTGMRETVTLTYNGRTINCTPEHPIIVGDGAWVEAGKAQSVQYITREGDFILENLGMWRHPGRIRQWTRIGASCIVWFGKTLMDRYRRGIISTTLMGIKRIIDWRILSVFLQESIYATTRRILKKLLTPPESGTVLLKDWRGTAHMARSHGSAASLPQETVATVARRINHGMASGLYNFVRQRVGQLTGGIVELTTRSAGALFARLNLARISMLRQLRVRYRAVGDCAVSVTRTENDKLQAVYNFSSSHGTYIAEGLFVSNCDAFKYVANAYLQLSMNETPQPTRQLIGYEALNHDIAALTRQKFARLGKKPQPRSRFF